MWNINFDEKIGENWNPEHWNNEKTNNVIGNDEQKEFQTKEKSLKFW